MRAEVSASKKKASIRGRLRHAFAANSLLLRGCFRFSRIALRILAAEALDATGGVHELLLAGEEWVAGGADFHADVTLVRRARGKCIPARAMHIDLAVMGMNGCFHVGPDLDSDI